MRAPYSKSWTIFLPFQQRVPESNPRMLEAWLVTRYGLLATIQILSFMQSAMSLRLTKQQRLLGTLHPHVDTKHFHVLDKVARTLSAVLKICQLYVLTPPTSHACFALIHLVLVYITSRTQLCMVLVGQGKLRRYPQDASVAATYTTTPPSETLGMVGLGIRKPGILLRLVTPALWKELCWSCSVC